MMKINISVQPDPTSPEKQSVEVVWQLKFTLYVQRGVLYVSLRNWRTL